MHRICQYSILATCAISSYAFAEASTTGTFNTANQSVTLFVRPAIYSKQTGKLAKAATGPIKGQTSYQALLNQIKNGIPNGTSNPLQVNRVVLALNAALPTSGANDQVVNDLTKDFLIPAKKLNPNLKIYLMPSAESGTAWANWNDWQTSANKQIPACSSVANYQPSSKGGMREVTKAVCFANIVAKQAPNTVTGVVFDGQGLGSGNSSTETVASIVHQSGNPIQTLGWVSGGFKKNADINFIEVYNREKGGDRIDAVSPGYAYEYSSKTSMFPTTQKAATMNPTIYSCAIGAANCSSQSSNNLLYNRFVNTDDSPAKQMIESWRMIYDYTPTMTPDSTQLNYNPIIPNMTNPASPGSSTQPGQHPVVYLFSTEDYGKTGSTSPSSTTCIASEYKIENSKGQVAPLPCGSINAFGAWNKNYFNSSNPKLSAYNPVEQFQKATSAFVTAACNGNSAGSQCNFGKNNMVGIFTWNYIPQSWISPNTSKSS